MLKLEHTLIYESTHADISPFLDKTVDELQEMRERSVSAEQLLFEKLQSSTTEWEKQGARTMLLDRAIEFLKTPQLKHTAKPVAGNRAKSQPPGNHQSSVLMACLSLSMSK
mgnify:CR=1 FL=1